MISKSPSNEGRCYSSATHPKVMYQSGFQNHYVRVSAAIALSLMDDNSMCGSVLQHLPAVSFAYCLAEFSDFISCSSRMGFHLPVPADGLIPI